MPSTLADLFDELPEDNEDTSSMEIVFEDQDGKRFQLDYVEGNYHEKKVIINIKQNND